jgi:hypothetical protein
MRISTSHNLTCTFVTARYDSSYIDMLVKLTCQVSHLDVR